MLSALIFVYLSICSTVLAVENSVDSTNIAVQEQILQSSPGPDPENRTGLVVIEKSGVSGRNGSVDSSTRFGGYMTDSEKDDSFESTRKLESRIAVLESTKQDMSVWITIFATSVILIITLNIGLSVWQVGSIAHREAEDYMREYEKQFENVIQDTIKQIDQKVESYETSLDAIIIKINELGPRFESSIEKTEDAIRNFASFSEKALAEFKEETSKAKQNIINEMEKWQEKMIKKTTPT